MTRRRHLTLATTGVAIAIATLGVVIVVSVAEDNESCKEFRFDRAAWLETGKGDGPGTLEQTLIAEKIVECRLLLGRRPADVRRMLGQPDYRLRRRPVRWGYELGPERSVFSIDSEFLDVTFGRKGTVKKARISVG